jgi:DsbC/DsbD-like thiol-disulfide interchange protein
VPVRRFTIAAAAALSLAAATASGQSSPPRPVLLDIAPHVSAERVTAGEHFNVTLALTPAAGIHVYAPDVVDYKPIVLTIKPQPGLVVRDVTYPPPEKYFYAPLKQTVDVYQKPFNVVQQLALDGSAAGRRALKGVSSVTVQGTLNYQACNEKICFPPRTVPVTWTVAIKEP